MAKVSIQDLLLAGCHFGHITRRWNPKMKPYIFMERNGIHIIDLKKTLECLNAACDEAAAIARQGGDILFVGTKKQAKDIVKVEADRCGMPYVTERWLGGTMTNFITVKKSVKRLKNLEKKATDGTYDKLAKKEILSIERDKEKLDKVLGGIRDMNHLPAAIIVVDAKKEAIAVREAKKLGVPVFAMLDTNADPDPIDYVIPCNDDAFKAINLVIHAVADAIIDGKARRDEMQRAMEEVAQESKGEEKQEKEQETAKTEPESES